MAWRVDSRIEPGRYVVFDGHGLLMDDKTRRPFRLLRLGPPIDPLGRETYEPKGPGDMFAAYLAALAAVPAAEFSGERPAVPPEVDRAWRERAEWLRAVDERREAAWCAFAEGRASLETLLEMHSMTVE